MKAHDYLFMSVVKDIKEKSKFKLKCMLIKYFNNKDVDIKVCVLLQYT